MFEFDLVFAFRNEPVVVLEFELVFVFENEPPARPHYQRQPKAYDCESQLSQEFTKKKIEKDRKSGIQQTKEMVKCTALALAPRKWKICTWHADVS